MKTEKIQAVLSRLGYPNVTCHPPRGRSGGLCLASTEAVTMEVTEVCCYYINVVVSSNPPGQTWMVSFVYGPPRSNSNSQFWTELAGIGEAFNGPWLCLGDFNSLLSQHDKEGGRALGSSSSTGLLRFLQEQGLVDLGFSGNRFTWSNKQVGSNNIKERLDRGIVNLSWRELFPNASVIHLPTVSSDHAPILLNTTGRQERRSRLIRFEEMWTRDPTCEQVIFEAWKVQLRGSPMYLIRSKQTHTKEALRRWNRSSFGHVQTRLKQLLSDLDRLQQEPTTRESLTKQDKIEAEYLEWLKREELLWRQKSRTIWLTSVDLNTRFFHLSTTIHRRHNAIDFLRIEGGCWTSNPDTIGQTFIRHFQSLFTTTSPPYTDHIHSLFPPAIEPEENQLLCAIPDHLEIQRAVFSLGSLKSPGPDGLPALFYQRYWKIIGDDMVRAVQSFFQGTYLLKELNHTLIALIPKGDTTETVHNFRPISLCNVSYKIISTILAARLKQILPKLISPFQSAFLAGRSIQDNSIVAHELMHYLGTHRGKDQFCAIKIDMEKAFDKVEWSLLLNTMRFPNAYRYANQWVHWISQCLSTVSYSVLVNGSPTGFFKPTRGIRQGDPLSSFLFLIATESLSKNLARAESLGLIQGIKIGRGCPSFTHLLFADDLLLFAKASDQNLSQFSIVLDEYLSWSGQTINRAKSSIFFSKNTPNQLRNYFCSFLGLNKGSANSRYLGLPLHIQRASTKSFQPIIESVTKKLSSWKTRVLSQAGRGVLIKSVAASIPVYSMSTFLLPKSVTTKLDSVLTRFWWGTSDSGKIKLPMKSWQSMCLPKKEGGLGFKKMRDQNLALLSKQAWALSIPSTKPHHQLLKARYLKHQPFLSYEYKAPSSFFWQGVCKTRDHLLSKGAIYGIGDGRSIDIWKDPWVPNNQNALPQPSPALTASQSRSIFTVSQLLNPDHTWDIQLLHQLFDQATISNITSIQLRNPSGQDKLIWSPNSNGDHSVKSAYLLSISQQSRGQLPTFNLWTQLWRTKIHERHKLFLWKLAWNILPTAEVINRRFPIQDTCCRLCYASEETLDHVMLKCPFAVIVWSHLRIPLNFEALPDITIAEWIGKTLLIDDMPQLMSGEKRTFQLQAVIAMDHIWQVRNLNRLHEVIPNPLEAAAEIKNRLTAYEEAWRIHKGSPLITTRPTATQSLTFSSDIAFSGISAWIGIVLCNSFGAIIAAWSFCSAAATPLQGEIEGIDKATSLAQSLNVQHFHHQTDAKDVADSLQSKHFDLLPQSAADLYSLLDKLDSFPTWSIEYVPRCANFLSHNVAKWSSNNKHYGPIGISDLPSDVLLRELEM